MSKIVVMDSGFGGLTVLKELKSAMPNEEYIYYGDSANAPYGEKTHDELLKLTSDICTEMTARYDVKSFVIACNTTSSEVWEQLTERFPAYDFVGIEPALKWAVEENPGRNILVLATTATTRGRRLKARYEELKNRANITMLAAPGIVPFVEGLNKDEFEFEAYLKELLKEQIGHTDCVVLGCTHFPFVKEELREVLGRDIRFYDAAVSVAEEVRRLSCPCPSEAEASDQSSIAAEQSKVPVFIHTEDREKKETTEKSINHEIIFLNSDPDKIETEKQLLEAYSLLQG